MHAIRFHSQICSYLEKSKRVKNRNRVLLIELLLPRRKQGPDRWVRSPFVQIFEGSPTSTKTTRKNRIRDLLSTTKPPYSSTRERVRGHLGTLSQKKSIVGDPLLVIAGVRGVPNEKGHPVPNNSTLTITSGFEEVDDILGPRWVRGSLVHHKRGLGSIIRGWEDPEMESA